MISKEDILDVIVQTRIHNILRKIVLDGRVVALSAEVSALA